MLFYICFLDLVLSSSLFPPSRNIVVQLSCPTLCYLMDYSKAGSSVLHYLQEFTQIHVHWLGDTTQPSHPLPPLLPSSIFPRIKSFPMSQLFTSNGQSTGASASVLPMNIQGWFPLVLTGLISLQSKEFSRVFSSIITKLKFFSTQPSLWSNSHISTWLLQKP